MDGLAETSPDDLPDNNRKGVSSSIDTCFDLHKRRTCSNFEFCEWIGDGYESRCVQKGYIAVDRADPSFGTGTSAEWCGDYVKRGECVRKGCDWENWGYGQGACVDYDEPEFV